MSATEHHRVSAEGRLLGSVSARLAEQGHQRLATLGVAKVQAPALRGEMCVSCACRPGTVPNGCLQTQLDFMKAVIEGVPFLCHAPNDGRLCHGWVGARAETVARPLPEFLQKKLGEWEFTPEDPA
jgi:hypothetical protein